jgi:hypothetical protein
VEAMLAEDVARLVGPKGRNRPAHRAGAGADGCQALHAPLSARAGAGRQPSPGRRVGTSKSAVSRRFVAATEHALAELLAQDLTAVTTPPTPERWRDGQTMLRGIAAGVGAAARQFRRVNGHLYLPARRTALDRKITTAVTATREDAA